MSSNLVACIGTVLVLSLTNADPVVDFGPCLTPNAKLARCIHLEQCTFLYNILTQSISSEEDLIFLRRSHCGITNGNILICCSDQYTNTRLDESTEQYINSRIDESTESNFYGSLPEPGVCGYTNADRIYGGNVTRIDEYPWLALIEYDLGGEFGHNCGGSLINYRYVLTAAHCISGIPDTWTPVRVRLGEWDISTNPDCQKDIHDHEHCADPYIDVPIERTIVHPNYKASSRHQLADIALIRLSHNISYTNFIQPVCLPLKGFFQSVVFDGIVMDVVGWGNTDPGKSRNRKQKAAVPGIDLQYCQKVYSKQKIHLQDSHLCAGNLTKVGSCNGDSGGPLIALDKSNKSAVYFYIAGIVSYGPSACGLKGWPAVYTKVSAYTDWIQANIEP